MMIVKLPAYFLGNHTIKHTKRGFLLAASRLLDFVLGDRCGETGAVEDELEQIHRLLSEGKRRK
jgi:hypothetical protein